ncbi:MAG: hypothetical protein DIU80_020705 [Chloroflexota bacterium]|nr:MAG: hypothetical protein DIU80_09390 [Chloroflexota bacterium]
MEEIVTVIYLPPGFLPAERARELLRLVCDDFQWLTPARYGATIAEEAITWSGEAADRLADFYAARQRLVVEGQPSGSALLLRPDRKGQHTTLGELTWLAPAAAAADPGWRAAHVRQVLAVMQRVQSPLAVSSLAAALDSKMYREVPDVVGTRSEPTVRGYGDGLAGLFWRNYFGPPYAAMLAPHLGQLPSEVARQLDDHHWLVEPYPLPAGATTAEGRAREQELIRRIGPEFFYDFDAHQPPSRTPFSAS